MTALAVHRKTRHVPVVEAERPSLDNPIGDFVAQRTPGRSFVQLLAFEVAKHTGRAGDRDVATLDDLGMT
jgi:hypothetical protein